jgi:hypothetical protein
MAFVTDPDDLDRFQVLVDPNSETINVKGLGAAEDLNNGSGVYQRTDGVSDTGISSNFTSALSQFSSGPVSVNDILAVATGAGGVINYYTVNVIESETVLTVSDVENGNPPPTGLSTLTFAIFDPTAGTGVAGGNVADGLTMQSLYSFLKEEWRTLSNADMADLIKFTFPFESITREQFEIGGPTHSGWDFANETTRQLMRTGGWDKLSVNNVIESRYPGVITLGSLDADAQAYYLQQAAGTPTDFILTGPVNQAIPAMVLKSGQSEITGDIDFQHYDANPDLVVDGAGGNWVTNGYASGDVIQIVGATDSANNGFFTIQDILNSGATNDAIRLATGEAVTDRTGDSSARVNAMTDYREFLQLFVRKKARSYVDSELSDIGVTSLESIVNRFPLAHVTDPAISLWDGQLAGDPSETDFQGVTVVDNGTTDDANIWDMGDGTSRIGSSGSTFQTDNLQVGDTINLSNHPGDSTNEGFYEIETVIDENYVDVYNEPGVTITDRSSDDIEFETYTSYRSQASSTGQIDDAPGTGSGVFTDASADFVTDGVVADDILVITGGVDDTNHIGVYKVLARQDLNNLVIDTSDEDTWPGAPDAAVDYHIKQPGMYLQYKSRDATPRGPFVTNGLEFSTAGASIQRKDAPYDWDADGYIVGSVIYVANTENSGENDGTYIISAISTTAQPDDTITCIAAADGGDPGFTNNTQDTTGTVTGEYGYVRTLNAKNYSFNWRLFGNGGDLSECFQWIQRQLRRATDIDRSTLAARGDITDLLMAFSTPTGTTLNMYIDDLDSGELNNVTKRDLLGYDRNFAFIAGVTINLNDNIINASTNKIVVFFTDPDVNGADVPGNEFGTVGAIIVEDKDSNDMQGVDQTSSPLTFEFDYDNNVQGGRNPAEAATNVTIVSICTDTGQYAQTTGDILRQSSNVFGLVAAQERNYSNP